VGKKIVGVDIDGVLANWNEAFQAVLVGMTGRGPTIDVDDPPAWDWPIIAGYSDEEYQAARAMSRKSASFWMELEPLPQATQFLEDIQMPCDDIYFLTSRPGNSTKYQTEVWLEGEGYQNPTVLITIGHEAKALAAKALQLTHFLDDSGENCLAVKKACPETQVFLLKRNYNASDREELLAIGGFVIDNIGQFIKELNRDRC
jgi:hypothetical protein